MSAADRTTRPSTTVPAAAIFWFAASRRDRRSRRGDDRAGPSAGAPRCDGPQREVTLGVIGIGPRCTYDLTSMLQLPDVQCVAIADVQATRRDAGRSSSTLTTATAIASSTATSASCSTQRYRRGIIATGDRWHSAASILLRRPAKMCIAKSRAASQSPIARRAGRYDSREKRVFQAGTQRRSVPNFQKAVELAHSASSASFTRCTPRSTCRCSTMPGCRQNRRRRATKSIGTFCSARPLGVRTTSGTSVANGAASGTSTPGPHLGLGRAYGRSLSVGEQGRRHDAGRVRPYRQEHYLHLPNGVKLVIDFLSDPFKNATRHYTHSARHLPGAVRRRRRLRRNRRRRGNRGVVRGPANRHRRLPTNGFAASTSARMPATSSIASSRAVGRRPTKSDAAIALGLATPRRSLGFSAARCGSTREGRVRRRPG